MSVVATPVAGTYEGSQTVSLLSTIRTGTKVDSRDGHSYKTVRMPDGKWWTAENLGYTGIGVVGTYGRQYDGYMKANVASPGSHLPTQAEFSTMLSSLKLTTFADRSRSLRSATDWTSGLTGLDTFGFNLKPNGFNSTYVGAFAWLLTATGDPGNYTQIMYQAAASDSYSPELAPHGAETVSVRLIVDSGNVEDHILYSLDGSYPSVPYTAPIVVSETTTLKALIAGIVYEFNYTILSIEPTFPILTPCTLQMLGDSKVANSSSGRRRTVSCDSSFVFSATLNLPSQYEQFESVAYDNFPVIGDCEIRQLDLVKYTFRDTEKTSSVKCMIIPNIMQKRTGDFRISCEPNISVDEARLVATGSSSLEVLSSSRALSLKCVWSVSFLGASQFIEWLRGSVNRIFTTSVAGMKGVPCQIGDSLSLEIGSTDVKISADLAIVNTKHFPLNVTASRVGNAVTVSTGTAYTGTLVNRSGEIVEVVTTATNVLTFTTYPENCYLLIRQGNNVTEWLEL